MLCVYGHESLLFEMKEQEADRGRQSRVVRQQVVADRDVGDGNRLTHAYRLSRSGGYERVELDADKAPKLRLDEAVAVRCSRHGVAGRARALCKHHVPSVYRVRGHEQNIVQDSTVQDQIGRVRRDTRASNLD